MAATLRSGLLFLCNSLDVDGRPVLLMRPARFRPASMHTSDAIKLLVYLVGCLLEDVRAQFLGYTLLCDFHHVSMANISRQYASTFFLFLQQLPVRCEA